MAALELADPDERTAYLSAECGVHTELRDRVEALLTAHDGAGPAPVGDATLTSEPSRTKTPEATRGSHAETHVSLERVTSEDRTGDANVVFTRARRPTVLADQAWVRSSPAGTRYSKSSAREAWVRSTSPTRRCL